MKRLQLILFLVALLAVGGCESRHSKNRAQATARWNSARLNIAINLAQEQFESGELDKAIVTMENALAMSPDYLPGYLLLGQIYLEKDQGQRAGEHFTKCLEMSPEHAAANYHLGRLFERWKDTDQALEHYKKAFVKRPEHTPYLLAVVETLLSLGQSDQALNLLVENQHLVRRDGALNMVGGEIYTGRGEHEQALGMYRGARNIEPDSLKAQEAVAFALLRLGRGQEALSQFQALEAAAGGGSSRHWVYALAIGDCYMQLGQLHEARRAFERVSTHDRLNPSVWVRLAQVGLARTDYKAGATYAHRALRLKADYPDALMVLGYVAMAQENFIQAQGHFAKVVKSQPQNGIAYCLLGQSLENAGQTGPAGKAYARALRINPDDALARQLLRSMQETL